MMRSAESTNGSTISGGWWDATRQWMRQPLSRSRPEPRIGLALGGGFARGIAHIGVLRAFERHHIPIHAVAGVSAGAMVAAAIAGGADSRHIEHIALSMRLKDVARWTINRMGLAGSDRMSGFLARLLPAFRFEDMKIPLAIVATDLNSGQAAIFKDRGDVVLPIRASCAYPGLFLPIHEGGRCLVDGFVSMEVPAQPLRRMGATHIVSVSIPNPAGCGEFGNMFALINRCFQVLSSRTGHEWRRYSNVVIAPAVAGIAWDSFDNAKSMIEFGEQAALAAMPGIKKWLAAPESSKPITANVLPALR